MSIRAKSQIVVECGPQALTARLECHGVRPLAQTHDRQALQSASLAVPHRRIRTTPRDDPARGRH